MERTPKFILGIALAALLGAGLFAYVYLQSREYLRGPRLTITEPKDGSETAEAELSVSGTAHNVSYLSLNGRQIFTDERGRFKELLLLHAGYNIMTLAGKDRFGQTREKRLELIYNAKTRRE
ncbi:MAG: Uncharacterized protein Greene041679_334 [Parcubacteria group bacterium Greene0416_79]|nr:MAG: Uncharacterized protein Greene041679_334 [Parcubacteria group bacterium Greene0416_79]